MELKHRRLYLEWCQSTPIKLVVDREDAKEESEHFLIPSQFLRHRSRKFREFLDKPEEHADGPYLLYPVHDTSVHTMEDFFIWTFSPQPEIDQGASFDDVVQLGILAWKYQIPALNNQATDLIRTNLANGEWALRAPTVDDVYEASPPGSPLREVVRAALGRFRSSVEEQGAIREEWRQTMVKHSQLGVDYLEATLSEWKRQSYLAGVCRFHDHQGVDQQNGTLADGCPYAREECYPTWENEEEEKYQEPKLKEAKKAQDMGLPNGIPKDEKKEKHHEPGDALVPQINGRAGVFAEDAPPTDVVAAEYDTPTPPTGQAAIDERFYDSEEAERRQPIPEPVERGKRISKKTKHEPAYREDASARNGGSPSPAGASPIVEHPIYKAVPEEVQMDHSPSAEGTGTGPDESTATLMSDSAVEEVDGPSTVEAVSIPSNEKAIEPSAPQTAVEAKSLGSGKKNKKKKRNSVSQRN
ncbi:hypothetical protein HRR83_001941 [Exophiala dermatitidis]|uniref:BTB domain-containing protein n=1 Tax=Exophiala dermatitidis TaxID=5970 RepID=A0AAN6EYU4_EXODE|nr:hypothetical protein HRR73_005437 [Exophiala dermatitidis]KAJ4519990.1 hypothetical protein HRR75_001851 [Exophiala dermatitidis]KAJ4523825.1 hypothetical protein HRR74_002018 [Exophiala dermatitidis]KAJ4537236.1 hypothetical protein HRR76_005250 [Exophiala dermatitidis]KAJ4555165.1 hypothetical protein HRR77_001105 [Exophiala dermatitidis]